MKLTRSTSALSSSQVVPDMEKALGSEERTGVGFNLALHLPESTDSSISYLSFIIDDTRGSPSKERKNAKHITAWRRVAFCAAMAVLSVVLCIIVLIISTKQPGHHEKQSEECVPLLEAAESAYRSQIDYVRRGLTSTAAQYKFAEFVSDLLQLARENANLKNVPAEDICVHHEALDMLQNSNGSIVRMAQLEDEIERSGARIAMLTHSVFPGDTSEDIGGAEWEVTKKYLAGLVGNIVIDSRILFPDEMVIRCDPYTEKACEQFEHWETSVGNISARNLTTNMAALVSTLLARGANETQSWQILLHSVAYSYLGARCRKQDKGELMLPSFFVAEYGRVAGKLGGLVHGVKGMGVDDVERCLIEEVDILTGYGGAGVIPSQVVDEKGNLSPFEIALEIGSEKLRGCVEKNSVVNEPVSPKVQVSSRLDGFCGAGFMYVEMESGEKLTKEHCCAGLCIGCAAGLGILAGRRFTVGCCSGCNEKQCDRVPERGESSARELQESLTLSVPPYGVAEGFAIRIVM